VIARLPEKALLALVAIPALAAIFGRIMALAFAAPNAPITGNILERPSIVVDRRADNGRVIDADTECIGLSVGLIDRDRWTNGALRATRASAVYGCDDFMRRLGANEEVPTRVYARYWHGYAVLARPLLAVMPYNDLRGGLLTLCSLMLALLAWRLGRDFGAPTALAFVAPFVVINVMGVMVVATKAVTLLVAFGGALYLQRRRAPEPPALVFFALGALTAFVDFLTAPAFVGALALIIHCAYSARAGTAVRWAEGAMLGAFFVLGWIGLILAKFLLAELTLGPGAFAQSLAAAAYRLRGESAEIDSYFPGAAIFANIEALKSYWAPVALIAFVIAPLARRQSRRRLADLWRARSGLVLAAAAPVAFLEALTNHSQIHAAFTQVNFAPAFIIAGMAMAGSGALAVDGPHTHMPGGA